MYRNGRTCFLAALVVSIVAAVSGCSTNTDSTPADPASIPTASLARDDAGPPTPGRVTPFENAGIALLVPDGWEEYEPGAAFQIGLSQPANDGTAPFMMIAVNDLASDVLRYAIEVNASRVARFGNVDLTKTTVRGKPAGLMTYSIGRPDAETLCDKEIVFEVAPNKVVDLVVGGPCPFASNAILIDVAESVELIDT